MSEDTLIKTKTVKAIDTNFSSRTYGSPYEKNVYRFDCFLHYEDTGILKEALELYVAKLEVEQERCTINSIRENIESRIVSTKLLIGRLGV